jgi:hypothetical protein
MKQIPKVVAKVAPKKVMLKAKRIVVQEPEPVQEPEHIEHEHIEHEHIEHEPEPEHIEHEHIEREDNLAEPDNPKVKVARKGRKPLPDTELQRRKAIIDEYQLKVGEAKQAYKAVVKALQTEKRNKLKPTAASSTVA